MRKKALIQNGEAMELSPKQLRDYPFAFESLARSQTFAFNKGDVQNLMKLQRAEAQEQSPKTPMRKLKMLYKQSIKNIEQQKNEELKKKLKDKQQIKRNDTIQFKMKMKLQQQLKTMYAKIEQKQKHLYDETKKIQKFKTQLTKIKQEAQDISNNEQMLQFKQKQLGNLTTIHGQLIEGAKRQLLVQRQIRVKNEERIFGLKKQILTMKNQMMEKRQMYRIIERLKEEKRRIEGQIVRYQEQHTKKLQFMSESIRNHVRKIINKKKKSIEEDIQNKVQTIRQLSLKIQDYKLFKTTLTENGIPPSSYYTYNQLKFVPELNFKTSKDSENILQLFNKQIHPKIVQMISTAKQPEQLIELRKKITSIEQQIEQRRIQIRKRQTQIDVIEPQTDKLKQTLQEFKRNHKEKNSNKHQVKTVK